MRGLRRESALKLASVKPATLGQASRISGVNPSDINILMVVIESGRAAENPTDEGRSIGRGKIPHPEVIRQRREALAR